MRSHRLSSYVLRLSLSASLIALVAGPAYSGAAYTYDSLGRLVSVRFDDGKQVSYTYDAAGNRTQVVVATAGANHAPVATPDSVTFGETNSSITFDPRLNDTDPDGNSLNLFSTTNGSLGTAVLSNGGTTITYSSTNHTTPTDTLYYTINDGQGLEATGVVTVTFTNLPPVAVNDAITTVRNLSKSFDPRVNDSDPGNDPLQVVAASVPLHGTATVVGGVGGTSISYAPALNYYGPDSFTYTINDSEGAAASATVNVTVAYGSAPPIAVNDAKTTPLNTAFTIDPRVNDSDPDGGPLTITAKTNGTKGTVVINAGTSVTYTPTTGQSGADSFTYTVTDLDGLTATATVNVTIQATNAPPVAVNDTLELYGTYQTGGTNGTNPTGVIDPRWNDTDPDGNTLTITAVTQPTGGTAVINGTGTLITVTRNTACPSNTPAVGPVTYTISDGQGGTASATISFTKLCENISN